MIRGVIKAKIAAGSTDAGSFGAAFCYNAGANGTDWEFESATAEGIMWSLGVIAKGAYGNFLIDVPALETGIIQTVYATTTSTTSTSTSTSTSSSSSTSTSTTTTQEDTK